MDTTAFRVRIRQWWESEARENAEEIKESSETFETSGFLEIAIEKKPLAVHFITRTERWESKIVGH
jgi:hypothetical protein